MKTASQPSVNNDIYHALGDRWYKVQDDPIALLRAESRLRNPWVAEELRARFAGRGLRLLDVGCGGRVPAEKCEDRQEYVDGKEDSV